MLSKGFTTNPLRALLLPHTPSHNSYALNFLIQKKPTSTTGGICTVVKFFIFRRGKSTYIFRYGKIFFKNNLQNIVFQRNIFRSSPSKKPHKSILSNSKNKNLTAFYNKKQPKNTYKNTVSGAKSAFWFSAFSKAMKFCEPPQSQTSPKQQ